MAAPDLIKTECGESGPSLLFIEPYLNHSHGAFAKGIMSHVPARWTLLGLPGRFFRWRMRGAAAYLALQARRDLERPWDGLICSSMLGLAELKGLCPSLAEVPSLVYFHENQLCYPVQGKAGQTQQDRDLYLAFSNLTSGLAAKRILFNSDYHKREVFAAADAMLKRLPDAVPADLLKVLYEKCGVRPVPLEVSEADGLARTKNQGNLRIVWNHRWEHDKDPETLFSALFKLAGDGQNFQVAILGPRSANYPKVFDLAGDILGGRLVHLGTVEDRREYWGWLFWADLAISTALQEYQGLSIAEAVWAGCRPLVPDTLVYPELYDGEFRYPADRLYDSLLPLVQKPELARGAAYRRMTEQLTWPKQQKGWQQEIKELLAR